MRLREIVKVIEESLPLITYNTDKYGDFMEVKNFIGAITAIDKLQHFNFIKPEIEVLKNLRDIYYNKNSDDLIRINMAQFERFNNTVARIKDKCSTVLSAIDQSILEEPENSVNVKLPDYEDLTKITRFFQDLNNALTMTLGDPRIGGKIEVEAFESGSLWITISLGTSAAVTLLSNMAHAALNVKKKYYEVEKTKLEVQAIGVQVEFLKHLEETSKAQLDLLVKAQAHELFNKQAEIQNSEPEYVSRMEKSIGIISNLFFEGAEIHKALSSPQNNQDGKFPEYNKLETEAGLKQLAEQKKLMPPEEVTGNGVEDNIQNESDNNDEDIE